MGYGGGRPPRSPKPSGSHHPQTKEVAMGAFEPTHRVAEYAEAIESHPALVSGPIALRLPGLGSSARIAATQLIARRYRKWQPQLDTPSLAGFVRRVHGRNLLSDSELAESLASPGDVEGGLFHLADLGAARLGDRTRLAQAIDKEYLKKRLQGAELDVNGVVTLAHIGNRLGLFNAAELDHALQSMDVETTQFAPYFWNCICDHALKHEDNANIRDLCFDPEFHLHEEGVVLSLTTPEVTGFPFSSSRQAKQFSVAISGSAKIWQIA